MNNISLFHIENIPSGYPALSWIFLTILFATFFIVPLILMKLVYKIIIIVKFINPGFNFLIKV